ncbi:MAG: IS21 family transposase, partial [Bacteroidota bacterium]
MIEWEKGMEIIQLYKEVGSIRKVAELTGHARETVTAIVQGRHCPKGGKRRRKSQLDPYKTYIKERFASGLSAQLIFNELSKTDYEGSYHTVQRFIKSLKAALKSQQQLTVRFETPPGQQAQMDWGYCGYLDNGQGERKRLYVFVCVLSYSRMIYVQFTDSMKLDTLIACHQACFDYFGGIPEEILYDNMKQVRLAPNKLNPAFDDFANYCGFTIRC